MLGLLILLGVALALVLLVLSIIMLREATHPPRRTAAYAVARNLPVDPGEMNLAYDQWILDRPDGAELPVWEIVGRRTRAPRITAVFVHGWGHSRIDSLSRITPWLQWCDRVVLYDLRGHGEASDGITWLGFREDDDLLALLERLAAERDDRFLLVGHSMGAVIAIAAASRASAVRSAIAGVIAYGPYRDFHTSLRGRLRVHQLPTRPMTDLLMLWLALRSRPPRSLRDEPSQLACPLFVVHGTEDRVSPMADARTIAHQAPQGSLTEIAGAAHSDPMLFENAEHLQQLEAFVQTVQRSE